jgi:hypothetical protein
MAKPEDDRIIALLENIEHLLIAELELRCHTLPATATHDAELNLRRKTDAERLLAECKFRQEDAKIG